MALISTYLPESDDAVRCRVSGADAEFICVEMGERLSLYIGLEQAARLRVALEDALRPIEENARAVAEGRR